MAETQSTQDASIRSQVLLDAVSNERRRVQELLAHLQRDEAAFTDGSDGVSAEEHDPDADAHVIERTQIAAQRALEQQRLVDLDDAADRLERGEFGFCSSCGCEIPIDRLIALPDTRFCVAHATVDQHVA